MVNLHPVHFTGPARFVRGAEIEPGGRKFVSFAQQTLFTSARFVRATATRTGCGEERPCRYPR